MWCFTAGSFVSSNTNKTSTGPADCVVLSMARLSPHFSGGVGIPTPLRGVLRCGGVMKGKREMRKWIKKVRGER